MTNDCDNYYFTWTDVGLLYTTTTTTVVIKWYCLEISDYPSSATFTKGCISNSSIAYTNSPLNIPVSDLTGIYGYLPGSKVNARLSLIQEDDSQYTYT